MFIVTCKCLHVVLCLNTARIKSGNALTYLISNALLFYYYESLLKFSNIYNTKLIILIDTNEWDMDNNNNVDCIYQFTMPKSN